MTAASATVKSSAGVKDKEKFAVLPAVLLIMGQMGTSGDNGAVSIATTALTETLGATMSEIQLATTVYPLVAASFMIAGGMLGTAYGFKKTFRAGCGLAFIGELIMAFAPNMAVFTWGGRLIVGLGGSCLIPSVLGLVPCIYHGDNRKLAFGCVGAAAGLSAILPLILGIVMAIAGMRVTFVVMGLYFGLLLLLSFKLPKIEQGTGKLTADGVGIAMAALGMFLLVLGISEISTWGLIEPFDAAPFTVFGISPSLPLIALGIIVLIALVKVEAKIEAKNGFALLPASFIHTKQVVAGLFASLIPFFFMGIQGILMSPYLQLVAGWSSAVVGALSIINGLPTFFVATLLPKHFPKANPRRVIQAGYIVMAVALVTRCFAITLHSADVFWVIVGGLLTGVGVGLVNSQANSVVALAVNERDAAQSGGIQATFRNIGQALGTAILGAVLLFGITSSLSTAAYQSDTISDSVATEISAKNITLTGDESFAQTIADIDMTDAERAELEDTYAQTRFDVTRIAYIVAAGLVLTGMFTTPWITKFEKDETI